MNVGEAILKNGVSNDDVLRLFREAQAELIAAIEKMEKGSSFGKFRRQQLLVIDRIVVNLDKEAKEWAKDALPPILDAGAKETYDRIKKLKEREFAVSFAGVNKEAANVFLEQAWGDFGNTMVGLRKSARNAALEKRKIQERIFKGFVQGTSSTKTQADLMRDLRKDGFTALKGANGFGRKWSLENYTNMLVRTQNVTAYSLGAKSQLLGGGRRYAIIPTLEDIDGEDVCNVWERKKYVDLLNDPLPPYHPNAVFSGKSFASYGKLDEMVRARYRGPSRTIRAGEHEFTIGPNHPMVTRRGLVPAKFLREGDELLYDLRMDPSNSKSAVHADVRNVPLIEDVFQSLMSLGGNSFVAPSGHDFHGDAEFIESKIDVVRPHGSLLPVFDASPIEKDLHFPLTRTDSESDFIAGSSTSLFGRNRVLLTPSGRMSLPLSWNSNCLTWLPITHNCEGQYSGWAYDASAEQGLYAYGGFVVSNCRHTPQPVSFEQLQSERPDLYQKAIGFWQQTMG